VVGSAGVAAAQPRVTVHGRVIDAHGKPIAGAEVSLEDGTKTVKTDANGAYSIAATPGASLIVLADHFGAGLGTAAEHADDIVLLPEETIEVHGDPPPQAIGSVRLDRSDAERMPGTGGDVVRTLTALPGVVDYPLPLGSSGVVIRGSSPQDSKILVDDFEVPRLYHDVGFRSILPMESIDTLEYVPGGFDVSYGRATSGVVEVTTRAGSDEPHEQVELGAGEVSALAQGTEHGIRYMASIRRSTLDLLLPYVLPPSLDLSMTTIPRYYDEQIRLDYTINSKWSLRVSSLGSDDALEVYVSRDRNPDKRYLDQTKFLRATAAATYHDGPWTAKLALSGIALESRFERGLYQHMVQGSPSLTARAEVLHSQKDVAGFADLSWRAGAEAVVTDNSLDVAMPKDHVEGAPPRAVDDPMDTSVSYMGTIPTTNQAAWTSAAASLDQRVRLTAGMRVDRYARTKDFEIEPRGELQITLTPKVVARFSAGAYSRPAEYEMELLAPLHAEVSRQLNAGLQLQPVDGLRVQGSVYYTDRDHLIAQDPMTGAVGNTGRGTTYGAELLATYKAGPWFAWATYSYSHSTRVDVPGMDSRLFDYDVPHSFNAAASYRWKHWQLGGRFRLQSGLPATPVDGAIFDSDANLYYPHFGPVNSVRAPMHHQLDLRVDRNFTLMGMRITQFLDVQNVYMNESAVSYIYGFDYTQRAAFHQLPIVPTVGLRGEF
jgi:outer membrane receptor protein involved in Fe transport